ncbi:MAG: hypothetical protein R6V45_09335 [Oceanipulchritudo sp.]
MTEEEQLARLCRNFGAAPPQDRLMARKLLERADQIARNRQMDKLQALQYLLSLMTRGPESGNVLNSAPQEGSPRPDDPGKFSGIRENR